MKLGIAPVGHSDKSPYNSIKALKKYGYLKTYFKSC